MIFLTLFFCMYKKIKTGKILFVLKMFSPIFALFQKREFSSAGLEHLPYKQRVGGSIPSTPTKKPQFFEAFLFFPCQLI